jgi:hypothetical protein
VALRFLAFVTAVVVATLARYGSSVRAGRDACPCRGVVDLLGCQFNTIRVGGHSGRLLLRQLAEVVDTEHIVVMPGDQPATTRVIAKRYRCTKITGFDATAKKHGHVGQCTIR